MEASATTCLTVTLLLVTFCVAIAIGQSQYSFFRTSNRFQNEIPSTTSIPYRQIFFPSPSNNDVINFESSTTSRPKMKASVKTTSKPRRTIPAATIVTSGKARENSFPYMVSIRRDGRHHCGGSIIGRQWILTAAHCLYNTVISRFRFAVGSHKLSSGSKLYKPSRIIIHSEFNSTSVNMDIALVKLRRPIEFNNKTQEIAWNTDPWLEFSKGVISGWGFSQRNSTDFPDEMQYLVEDIITSDECQNAHSPIPIYVSYICGKADGVQGLCGGDSGSPLVYMGKQIGIASWIRQPCGDHPDVYVNVAYFSSWINYTMLTC